MFFKNGKFSKNIFCVDLNKTKCVPKAIFPLNQK